MMASVKSCKGFWKIPLRRRSCLCFVGTYLFCFSFSIYSIILQCNILEWQEGGHIHTITVLVNPASIPAPARIILPESQINQSVQHEPEIKNATTVTTKSISRKLIVAAAEKPIVVDVMTSHFFGSGFIRTQDSCQYQDVPLQCTYKKHQSRGGNATEADADVLWYHAPSHGGKVAARAHPLQLRCVMSMESSAYYPRLDDPTYMAQFDIESTYRRSSDIPLHYFNWTMSGNLSRKPLPLTEKKKAIAYLNSNCGAKNGRHQTVQALVNVGIVYVDGYGS